ncbi:MAG TPA: S24/S26 family peptidase [Candidatus Eremiobacteraceae bacterium]|nr:S24/S26 family peptidase [Candidatus Eremiobacteraceae bacterium]
MNASSYKVSALRYSDPDGPTPAGHAVAFDLAEEVVRKFGWVRLRVTGTSMMPFMLPGDLVTVKRANINAVSSGEIVLFKRPGGFALHRVVAKTTVSSTFALLTRGDRLQYNDPVISSEALLGRVESIERNGRQFRTAARPGFLMGIVAVVLRSSDAATYLYLQLAKLPGKFLRDRSATLENGYPVR